MHLLEGRAKTRGYACTYQNGIIPFSFHHAGLCVYGNDLNHATNKNIGQLLIDEMDRIAIKASLHESVSIAWPLTANSPPEPAGRDLSPIHAYILLFLGQTRILEIK